MKLLGELHDVVFTEKSVRVSFDLPIRFLTSVNKIAKSKLLVIDIDDHQGQRSLRQNALLWELIHKIDVHENGRTHERSEMMLYVNLIKSAKIRIDYFQTIAVAGEMLSKAYRYIEEKEKRISNGVETVVYACYRGSSQFNKTEMASFIDVILNYAQKIGLDIDYYVDELSLKPIRREHDRTRDGND